MAGLDVQLENYFPDGYFCTGFYLIADETTGLLRYAGVGHPPAIVVGPDGIRTLDSNPGLLGVGMVDGTSGGTDRLQPGESLLIYTDGLPDAATPSEEMFGQPRIEQILDANKGRTPDEILSEIEKIVAAHVHPGSAADDMNMVLIQFPPEG
jgi:sigma-B regulation protein RsbU (phosphoserine phosphatase)